MNSGLSPLAKSLAMDPAVVRQYCVFPEPRRHRRRKESPIIALAARYLALPSPDIGAVKAMAAEAGVKHTSLHHAIWRLRCARERRQRATIPQARNLP